MMMTSSVVGHTSAPMTTNATAPATAPKCNDDGHQHDDDDDEAAAAHSIY